MPPLLLKKIKNIDFPLTFSVMGHIHRTGTEPIGLGKEIGSIKNRSKVVWRGGSDRWGL
jgi:hypothetical protein